jgi:hypothetical protein
MTRGLEKVGPGTTTPKNHIPHSATETSKNDTVVSKNQKQTTDGNNRIQNPPAQKKIRNKIHVKSM